MAIKIVLLLTLLAYSIIVSQSFMYILALRRVQLSLAVNSYTELRKLIDTSMRSNFKYIIYAALLTNLMLIILTLGDPAGLLFIMGTIAFVALIADTLITVKGNLPINDIINNWSSDNYPADWSGYRAKWLVVFQYRQIVNIIGFICLLIGAVFGTK